MATEERVLCFERKLLEELGVFEGLSLEIEKYLPVITSASHLRYLNRSDAEQDKRYKQLIPYVLVICNGKIYGTDRAEAAKKHGCTDFISLELGEDRKSVVEGKKEDRRGYTISQKTKQ